MWKYYVRIVKEKAAIFIAWRLPPYLVMWCTMRLVAYATQGKYGNTIVSELSAMDAVKRWETFSE